MKIKLQYDFLGPFFVDSGNVIRPMGRNGLKLTGELAATRIHGTQAYTVTDLNDDQETWHATMKEVTYLEAQRFLKTLEFERFVCLASGQIVCKFGRALYPSVMQHFPQDYDANLPHVRSHLSLARTIERSYYRRLAQNHFMKARALRDGDMQLYGMSTDVITKGA
ncbi:MAG: hypothetical protein ABSF50_02345 [Burkholderiaceae bacterium]|jgi:hypothetical protein